MTEYHLAETEVRKVYNPDEGRGWVQLRYDPWAQGPDGRTHADVFYASGGGLQPGDQVSLNWADNAAPDRYYHACDHTVPAGYTTTHTWGVNHVGDRVYRICLHNGSWRCSIWWNSLDILCC